MFFTAYSPQLTVAADTNYSSGNAQVRERPAGATPPTLSCNCRLAGRFRCFSRCIQR